MRARRSLDGSGSLAEGRAFRFVLHDGAFRGDDESFVGESRERERGLADGEVHLRAELGLVAETSTLGVGEVGFLGVGLGGEELRDALEAVEDARSLRLARANALLLVAEKGELVE